MALTFEMIIVIAIILLALVLFITEIFPAELVALMIMTLLMLSGVVTPEQGVSGFSNPATLTILALFVISAGVYRTGVVTLLARRLSRITGKSETRVLLVLIVVVGPVSAFINNTAAVAILIPMVMTLAKESNTSPSKLLIPLSYFSMLAGTITLIGTSTNILTSILVRREVTSGPFADGFNMFTFSQVGLVVFVVGAVYIMFIGRYLIPARIPVGQQSEDVLIRHFLTEARVRPNSNLVGKTVYEARLRERYKVDVIRVLRGMKAFDQPLGDVLLEQGDVLVIRSPPDQLTHIEDELKVTILPSVRQEDVAKGTPAHVVEVVVSPNSSLVRRTLSEATFAQAFGVKVLGIRHHGPAIFKGLGTTRLDFGDTLLVLATPEALESLREDPDFIVGEEAPVERYRPEKVALGVGITGGVVAVAALNIYPILVAAMAGAVLMVLTRVLRTQDLWTSVRWDVIFLLAGIIPLGIAMEETGLDALVGSVLAGIAMRLPDIGVVMLFYLASMFLTSIISNNATVVLLVPIAFATAVALNVSAIPLVLALMFAASSAFMTPIGYQTNLMVYGPGEYRFADFMRVGLPLNLLLLVVTSFAILAFFPLR